MGICWGDVGNPYPIIDAGKFRTIGDEYKSLEDLSEGLRMSGLETSNLIIGIDYTKSNLWTGKNSYGGLSLHHVSPGYLNPYQRVIDVIGKTLEPFDEDHLIPAFGFGDISTTDKSVFPFFPDGRPCHGFQEVLDRYTEITPHIQLSGPTSFAALINAAVNIVEQAKSYHILIIICDGQVTNEAATADAIIRASYHPLSIVMIGVGDGPWDMMKEFDDKLTARRFDNFQFVNFTEITSSFGVENPDLEFAKRALMEVPAQFKICRQLGYFNHIL
eukprot:TRINITY_DN15940_c0_g1_i1.p1 TRINITY_DN15940_c0_g1~~TRINITY_DN15940_c0_g1_i1.p1  ORF type:complete len:274 (+),score=57.97 TRINITY_DN15940_c0_g1_i1:165-986(+)